MVSHVRLAADWQRLTLRARQRHTTGNSGVHRNYRPKFFRMIVRESGCEISTDTVAQIHWALELECVGDCQDGIDEEALCRAIRFRPPTHRRGWQRPAVVGNVIHD